jgi:hypothetical protein
LTRQTVSDVNDNRNEAKLKEILQELEEFKATLALKNKEI